MGRGLCSAHEGVVHQYTTVADRSVSPYWETVRLADLFGTSCLNGWTCGNIAARPAQLARLVHHLFSPSVPPPQRLLSADSLAQMQRWHPFTGVVRALPGRLGALTFLHVRIISMAFLYGRSRAQQPSSTFSGTGSLRPATCMGSG